MVLGTRLRYKIDVSDKNPYMDLFAQFALTLVEYSNDGSYWNKLGKYIKTDIDKTQTNLATYTYIYVEVDLSEGLPDKMILEWKNCMWTLRKLYFLVPPTATNKASPIFLSTKTHPLPQKKGSYKKMHWMASKQPPYPQGHPSPPKKGSYKTMHWKASIQMKRSPTNQL